MDKPEAERLYDSGKEPTVEKLLEYDAEVKSLKEKIAQWERDSRNSSKPPSSDRYPVKPKGKGSKGKRRPGGQPQHKGVNRELIPDGLDEPPLPTVPDFVKSLPIDKAMEDDIIVAYEMNGSHMPLLNGFPARLIVPGWYATYWVKSLAEITVLPKAFEGFWVKDAYRIPDTPCGCTPPGWAPKKTVPITRMTTRSLIIEPAENLQIPRNTPVEIMGIAFSGGYSIREVIVSVDGGRTWEEAELGKDMGRYAWTQWKYLWRPDKPQKYTLMAKATNSVGESQPFEGLWNPGGYLWNKVEKTEVVVI